MTIDGGNPDGTLPQQFVARYAYIVKKYGTAKFEDFVFGKVYDPNPNMSQTLLQQNNVAIIITLVSVTTMAVSLALVFYFVKRRKEVK